MAGLAQPLGSFNCVQPGIIAKAVAGREIRFDPAVRRVLDQVLDGQLDPLTDALSTAERASQLAGDGAR